MRSLCAPLCAIGLCVPCLALSITFVCLCAKEKDGKSNHMNYLLVECLNLAHKGVSVPQVAHKLSGPTC